jgi:eukaryotic-like serine/threonine-protein kinase
MSVTMMAPISWFLEYLDGQTLKQRLQSGALLAQAVRCAIEVADALAKAHRLGIVHRDLKPGNLMLTNAGTKLLDFGFAKLKPTDTSRSQDVTRSASLTQHGAIFGTLQYMAPEQLRG